MFRTLQEALSNVARHAGATAVEVRLGGTADAVTLAVHDNGVGFAWGRDGRVLETESRMGMTGMRERMLAVGG